MSVRRASGANQYTQRAQAKTSVQPPGGLLLGQSRQAAQSDVSPETMRRVAALVDQDCPPDILEQMASYPDEMVRYTVAAPPRACPAETLRQLLSDSNIDVARAAAYNPNTSAADRAMWQLGRSVIPSGCRSRLAGC